MKRCLIIALLATLAGAISVPAAQALSCAELDPVDWAQRFPALDAAYVGWVTNLDVDADEVSVTVAISDVLAGPLERELTYAVPNHDPWGPYYETGRRIAVVVDSGTVSDGVQELCGPWYLPEELREAARRHGSWQPSVFDHVAASLLRILRSA